MNYKTILLAFILFFLTMPLLAQTVSTNERTSEKIGEGIFVIRHKDAPDGNPQGNTAVIIGDLRVIVVDAPYLPSSAKADIEQIRKWTSKPVDILINTHWHADHQQGNAVYSKAFPNLIILAHEETTKEMLAFEGVDLDRYKKNFLELKHRVESGKNESG